MWRGGDHSWCWVQLRTATETCTSVVCAVGAVQQTVSTSSPHPTGPPPPPRGLSVQCAISMSSYQYHNQHLLLRMSKYYLGQKNFRLVRWQSAGSGMSGIQSAILWQSSAEQCASCVCSLLCELIAGLAGLHAKSTLCPT